MLIGKVKTNNNNNQCIHVCRHWCLLENGALETENFKSNIINKLNFRGSPHKNTRTMYVHVENIILYTCGKWYGSYYDWLRLFDQNKLVCMLYVESHTSLIYWVSLVVSHQMICVYSVHEHFSFGPFDTPLRYCLYFTLEWQILRKILSSLIIVIEYSCNWFRNWTLFIDLNHPFHTHAISSQTDIKIEIIVYRNYTWT